MLFLGERERPLHHQEVQEASGGDLTPFSTKNLSGFQSSAYSQTSQMISAPKHFHSPQGEGTSRNHKKNRSFFKDQMSLSLHAALPGSLRSACTGHRHLLPTEAILGYAPGATDSENTLVSLQQSLLTQVCATSSS